MGYGIFAGICWALETIVLGIVLEQSAFVSSSQALFLAPFVSTFIHDLTSSFWASLYNIFKGDFGKVMHVLFRTLSGKYVVLGAVIGGPIGMTGYVLAIQYMGASMGAVASAIFPAVGSILACIFLKEKISKIRWLFLMLTLVGVYGLGYSSDLQTSNFVMGIFGVCMCSLGWGSEAVILAKALQGSDIKDSYLLPIRQATSALVYGCILLPVLKGWSFTIHVCLDKKLLFLICMASLFATISYLFYYRAIHEIGAAKAMALNVSYSAWALIFSVLFFHDFSLLNPYRILCTAMVLVCGILSATDYKDLRNSQE